MVNAYRCSLGSHNRKIDRYYLMQRAQQRSVWVQCNATFSDIDFGADAENNAKKTAVGVSMSTGAAKVRCWGSQPLYKYERWALNHSTTTKHCIYNSDIDHQRRSFPSSKSVQMHVLDVHTVSLRLSAWKGGCDQSINQSLLSMATPSRKASIWLHMIDLSTVVYLYKWYLLARIISKPYTTTTDWG